jgi:uncharacterized Zn finger protein (UPF0148 family)
MNKVENPEDHEYDRDETKFADPDVPILGTDQKLVDLMMRGWVMLAETCPIETCRCPLMKDQLGQKYCAGCEMWHIDQDRTRKQRFGELVSLQGKQNITMKGHSQSTELSKVSKPFEFNVYKNVVQSLQLKLVYLSTLLNAESDLNKTQQILECMRLCMENIKNAK